MTEHSGESAPPREWVIVKATRGYNGGMGYLGPSWGRAGLPIPTSPFVVKEDAERAAAALLTVNLCGWKVVPYRPPFSDSSGKP